VNLPISHGTEADQNDWLGLYEEFFSFYRCCCQYSRDGFTHEVLPVVLSCQKNILVDEIRKTDLRLTCGIDTSKPGFDRLDYQIGGSFFLPDLSLTSSFTHQAVPYSIFGILRCFMSVICRREIYDG
jgi:hypothetical protein